MTFTLHQEALNKLCRLCGRLAFGKNNSSATLCTKYIKEAGRAFNVNIWKDDELIHPRYMCWRCTRVMRHVASESRSGPRQTEAVIWSRHEQALVTHVTCIQHREKVVVRWRENEVVLVYQLMTRRMRPTCAWSLTYPHTQASQSHNI